MAERKRFETGSDAGDADFENLRDDLFSEYVERLNRGDSVDYAEILAKHPGVGADVVKDLKLFQEIGQPAGRPSPLRRLGEYELRREIGRGGMGVVYEAWESSMDRRVALKVLPAAFAASKTSLVRFVREARLAGKLHHPNVVPVFGMKVTGETPHYAMLTGQSPRTSLRS